MVSIHMFVDHIFYLLNGKSTVFLDIHKLEHFCVLVKLIWAGQDICHEWHNRFLKQSCILKTFNVLNDKVLGILFYNRILNPLFNPLVLEKLLNWGPSLIVLLKTQLTKVFGNIQLVPNRGAVIWLFWNNCLLHFVTIFSNKRWFAS